jgi:hypothetical protein
MCEAGGRASTAHGLSSPASAEGAREGDLVNDRAGGRGVGGEAGRSSEVELCASLSVAPFPSPASFTRSPSRGPSGRAGDDRQCGFARVMDDMPKRPPHSRIVSWWRFSAAAARASSPGRGEDGGACAAEPRVAEPGEGLWEGGERGAKHPRGQSGPTPHPLARLDAGLTTSPRRGEVIPLTPASSPGGASAPPRRRHRPPAGRRSST